jgi:hypothetical protein
MAEIAQANEALDATSKINKLLKENVVTAMVEKLVNDTQKHIEDLEKYASDIETFTVTKGLALMRRAVRLGQNVQNYGEDWAKQKILWRKSAEAYADILKGNECTCNEQMDFVQLLVEEIVEGTEKFIKRGRELQFEVKDVETKSKITEQQLKDSAKSLLALKKESVKKARLGHFAWVTAMTFPPIGLIPGVIATIVIEGYTIPSLKEKIDDVKTRLKGCTKVWGDIGILTEEMQVVLEKWLAEANAINLEATNFQNTQKKAKRKPKLAKYFQPRLIKSFEELSDTLKKYA